MKNPVKSEHVLEIRYKPIGAFLDIRGSVADQIAESTHLKEWSISEHRIDFKDAPEKWKDSAFVSYRNCGYLAPNPATKSYFPDQATKFLRKLREIPEFKLPPITRIGVRSTFIAGCDKKFDELLNLFIDKLGLPKDKLAGLFSGEIIDAGLPLYLRSNHGRFNITTGPMEEEQIKGLFRGKDELPKIGLYFDIDYFKEDLKETNEKELAGLIKTFADESWEKSEKLFYLIFENQ